MFARKLLDCDGIYYPVGIGPKGLCTSMWPLTPEEMQEKYATRENTIDNGYKFLGQKINAVFSVGNMLMRYYSTYDKNYAQKYILIYWRVQISGKIISLWKMGVMLFVWIILMK